MVRFDLQVSVPQRDRDAQEVPLLNLSAPASPTSPPHPHLSPTPSASSSVRSSLDSHSVVMPVKDALTDSFSLPSRSAFSSSASSSSSSSSSPSRSCPRALRPSSVTAFGFHSLLVLVSLLCLHRMAMAFQQAQLQCQILSASHLLSRASMASAYWWDFGTLLGLVREGDNHLYRGGRRHVHHVGG